jgi:hypothetical protein
MKIRSGFVSNSSSSSFCIYGCYIYDGNDEEFKQILFNYLSKNYTEFNDKKIEYEKQYLYEFIFKIKKYLPKDISLDFGESKGYIGRKYNTLRDEETGEQFKKYTDDFLSELFQKKTKGQYICDET